MNTSQHTIIAIVGASASGKSLFAKTIYDELVPEVGNDNIAIIKEDSYYRNQDNLSLEQRLQINYDHPDAFEHELLAKQLDSLLNGQAINLPQYCYKSHTRKQTTESLASTKIILVEGILLLQSPLLRRYFDIKVFMDTPLDICLIRRIKRDMEERGRSLDSITQQYQETVRPMYFKYIEPSKAFADLVVTKGGKNRMAIEVLKAKIRQLLQG